MKNYSVKIWYRYVANGEQHKDFEVLTYPAMNPQSAIDTAFAMYESCTTIKAFKFEIDGVAYAPTLKKMKFINTKTSGSETDKKIKELIYNEIVSENISVERFKTLLRVAKTLKIKIWE